MAVWWIFREIPSENARTHRIPTTYDEISTDTYLSEQHEHCVLWCLMWQAKCPTWTTFTWDTMIDNFANTACIQNANGCPGDQVFIPSITEGLYLIVATAAVTGDAYLHLAYCTTWGWSHEHSNKCKILVEVNSRALKQVEVQIVVKSQITIRIHTCRQAQFCFFPCHWRDNLYSKYFQKSKYCLSSAFTDGVYQNDASQNLWGHA